MDGHHADGWLAGWGWLQLTRSGGEVAQILNLIVVNWTIIIYDLSLLIPPHSPSLSLVFLRYPSLRYPSPRYPLANTT